jgi:opacity protein-like surface antigen
MKNLRLLFLVTVSMIACASTGYAKDYYVSGKAGAALAQGKLTSENLHNNDGSTKKSLSNSAVFDAIIGRNINSNLSAELEIAYARHKFSRSGSYHDDLTEEVYNAYKIKSNISSTSGFVNGKYKFTNLTTSVIPYVKAGIGFSSNRTGNTSYTVEDSPSHNLNAKIKTKNNFAWQVGLGALVPVNEAVSLDFSCDYKDLGKVSTINSFTQGDGALETRSFKGRLKTLNLMAGVTFNF